MSDFSKAEYSKNHKASFDAAIKSAFDSLTSIREDYDETWKKIEILRKERAAIIEDIIKLFKDNNIKLKRQYSGCTNQELNEVIESTLTELDYHQLEVVKCALVKINIRYEIIEKLSKKLEDLTSRLSQYRTAEPDFDDEVVIDFSKIKKSKSDKIREKVMPEKNVEEEKVEVVGTRPASETLLASISEYLDNNQKKEPMSAEDVMLEAIIEEKDFRHDRKNSDIETTVKNTNELLSGIEAEEQIFAVPSEEPEYASFKLDNNVNLKIIAEKVYCSPDLWIELYNYGPNKNRIDRVAAEHDVSYEVVCTEKGYLNGVELLFPLELIKYEPISQIEEPEERSYGKAA